MRLHFYSKYSVTVTLQHISTWISIHSYLYFPKCNLSFFSYMLLKCLLSITGFQQLDHDVFWWGFLLFFLGFTELLRFVDVQLSSEFGHFSTFISLNIFPKSLFENFNSSGMLDHLTETAGH